MARPRSLAAALLASLLLAALLAGPAAASGDDDLDALPPQPGDVVPDFALADTAGRTVHLYDFKGRAILLSFWSCFTDTCFTTVGVFEALLAKLGPLGLVAPTICEEVPPALAEDHYAGLLKRCSAGQRILVDEKGSVRKRYQANVLPMTIFIGPDFRIREVLRGVPELRDPAFHARLEDLVRRIAADAPAAAPASQPGP